MALDTPQYGVRMCGSIGMSELCWTLTARTCTRDGGARVRRDLRLLPIAGGACAVALVCVFVPPAAGWCALAGVFGVMGLTAWMLRRVNRPVSHAALVLVVLAAMGAVSIAAVSALPARESARVVGWACGRGDGGGDVVGVGGS